MTHFKHIPLICLALALSVPGCIMVDSLNGIDTNGDQQAVVGSGRIVSVSFDFVRFRKISLNNAFKATINRSNSYSVTIDIDDNVKQYLNVYQYGDEIFIGLEDNTYRKTTMEVTIGMPDIERIETSGAVSARLDGFVLAHGMEFATSGATTINGNLTADVATFALSGSTTVELAGSANSLLVNGSGATVLHLFDFPVKDCRASLSGGSTSNVSVSDNLEVNLSGGSIFRYKGNPVVRVISVSGGSIIQKVG